MERTAELAPENGEVFYDLAVIRLAAGLENEALDALRKALHLNPKLRDQASKDGDLSGLRDREEFQKIAGPGAE